MLVTEGSTKAIRVTLEKAISIWWAALWRLFLSAAGLGVGAALVIPLLGKPQLDVPAGVMFGAIWLCLILLSIWALRRSLSRQHGGYSVVLGKAA